MKKVLMCAVLVMIMLAGMSYATETRVKTMGDANMIVKDEANVTMFPSTINYYPRLVGGMVTDGDLESVYGHMMLAEESKPMVMGFYFYTYNDGLPYGAPYPGGDYNRLDFYYARYLGENPFGLKVEFDNASESTEAEGDDSERSFMRVNFTIGLSMMEKKLDAAAYVGFSSWSYVDEAGEDVREPSGNMEFGLWGRYWMDPMGKYTLVPHAGFWMGSEGYDVLPDGDEYKESDMFFDVGLGTNYDASEDVLMVTDLGIRYESFKDEYPGVDEQLEDTETELVLPYFKLGLDADILKWLDVRVGVVSEWQMFTDEADNGDKDKENEVDTWTYLGAGFHWGDFMIDTEINPQFLNDGPNFISGGGTDYYDKTRGDFAYEVSLIYWLD